MSNVFGYVNSVACNSRDEFIFKKRGFGPIENDEELLKYAEKASAHWLEAGHGRTFDKFYLSDYALAHPYCDLTHKEFERLKEMQKEYRHRLKQEDEAKEWKYQYTNYWMDNSVEEVWVNKYGETRTDMVVAPHGDIC